MPPAPVPERPVLVATAAFDGDLRAAQAAGHLGRGIERAGLMPPDLCPVADGGAGTVEALLPVLGGELVPAAAPAAGAQLALLEDGGTALVEPPRDDTGDSSAVGALVCAAVEAGAGVVVLAAGGAGVIDGGAGALAAIADHGGLRGAALVVLCGVRTPYEQAAGADVMPRGSARDPRGVPMGGAAGGLAGALWAAHGATLAPAGAWMLDALGFDARMRRARAVVCGAGRLDERTLRGGVLGEIGTRTRQGGVPLHAVVGHDGLDGFGRRLIDLQVVQEAGTGAALEASGERLGRALATGEA
jgi:glycerate kinase